MLCAISGEAPQQPVVSLKSGNVFEKRLIESYIAENHSDPVTGESLSTEDLVELKSARVVRPRPPTLTSIPSLLSVFQNEWDALALETYTLKQQLSELRQELSTALYNNDAAVRTIARLSKERDEARDALAKISVAGAGAATDASSGGDAMQIDGSASGLPTEILDNVTATLERLSKTRKKRPVPEGWTTPESVSAFELQAPSKVSKPDSHTLAIDATGELVLLGGADGSSSLYSLERNKQVHAIKGDNAEINDAVIWGADEEMVVLLATSSGEVRAVQGGKTVATTSAHAGAVTALSMHASGTFFASAGIDKSIVFQQLLNGHNFKTLLQTFVDSHLTTLQFHPDGNLLAAGSSSGEVKIFDVKTTQNVANFACEGPVRSIDFSENGYWLAVAVEGSTAVQIWDLRKSERARILEVESNIKQVKWDYSGQYLAAVGASCVSVQYYDKPSKSWSECLRKACDASAVQWMPKAKGIVLLTEGSVRVLA